MPDENVTVNAGQTDYSISVSENIEHGSVAVNVGDFIWSSYEHLKTAVSDDFAKM